MTPSTIRNNFAIVVVYTLLLVLSFYPLSDIFAEESGATATTTLQPTSTSTSTHDGETTPVVISSLGETPGLQSVVPTTTPTSTQSEEVGGENMLAPTSSASTTGYEMTSSTTASTTTTTQGQGNEASSTHPLGDTSIVSGTSVAMANVLNLVNTNFVNSNGVIVFKNFFDTLLDNFDLRNLYNTLSGGCSFVSCSEVGVQTSITNGATLDNDLAVKANSGGNTIDGSGHASIATGDAYAGVNLINLANTNVVDSNYLLVTMNAFKDVNGDIVFPSLSKFFSTLGSGSSPSALSLANTADVTNNVNLTAGTGNNSAAGASSSTISTGESSGGTNVFNEINTSLVGGKSMSILFRVHGTWAGEVFGAPENLGWLDDGKGGIYLFDKQGTPHGQANVKIAATNTVAIHNNVSVVALTGDNAISGADTALISTGNAYAGANIINVANATVVGRNWILAVINIFGDFKGNIAFGRPDLWVGGKVAVPPSITNASDLKYTLTVINNGDSPATKVALTDTVDTAHLDIHDASLPYTTNQNGSLVWQLPDLPPGKATEITYYGHVKSAGESTDITSTITVNGHETDNNRVDNTDTVTVTTDAPTAHSGSHVHIQVSSGGSSSHTSAPVAATVVGNNSIGIERLTPSPVFDTTKGGKVTEHLILRNNTKNSIPGVVLHDILRSSDGTVLRDEPWDLGTVLPHEEINISYDITFGSSAHAGLYHLDTHITSSNGVHEDFTGNGTILLSSSPKPVLGLEASFTNLVKKKIPLSVLSNASFSTKTSENYNTSSTSTGAGTLSVPPPPLYFLGKQQALAMSALGIPFRYSVYLMSIALLAILGLRYFVRTSPVSQQTSAV